MTEKEKKEKEKTPLNQIEASSVFGDPVQIESVWSLKYNFPYSSTLHNDTALSQPQQHGHANVLQHENHEKRNMLLKCECIQI